MIRLNRPTCPEPARLTAGVFNHVNNKVALINASHGKCMYCEVFVSESSFGEVEHIKPKSIFPALEFDWNNLGFVCQRCNNSKGNKYDAALEIVNPYSENPEEFLIASGSYVFQKQGNARGEKTIRDVDLNRNELLEKRQELISRIQKSIDAAFRTPEPLRNDLIAELKKEAEQDKEFSFVVKQRLEIDEV